MPRLRRFTNRLPRSIRKFFRRVRIEPAPKPHAKLEDVLVQAVRTAREEGRI